MNSILRRRRGMMGKKGEDPTLLYHAENVTVVGTATIDTGLVLLDSDKTFSIIADITRTGTTGDRQFFSETSSSKGILITLYNTATEFRIIWGAKGNGNAIPYPGTDPCKIQIAYIHVAESDKVNYYVRFDDSQTIYSGQISSTFVAVSSTLKFNGWNNATRWSGKINKADIYSRELTQTEVYDYFGYTPS